MLRNKIIIFGVLIIIIFGVYFWSQSGASKTEVLDITQNIDANDNSPKVIATGLDTPWAIVTLPDGNIMVTERTGNLVVLDKVSGAKILNMEIPDVVSRGEGGLMGLALDPRFKDNGYIYFTAQGQNGITNRVVRYTFKDNELRDPFGIIDGIPAGSNHNGGRIAFGPDGLLYITAGEAGVSTLAQNTKSLGGKILRLNADGTIPKDNPFGNAVYSYGHRNPQGIAWDKDGGLWATEHGRSGVQSGLDEINYIVKGGNYGWPSIEGDKTKDGMITPVINSGPSTTWAPSGLAYKDDHLYFAGLRGQALYEVPIVRPGVLGTVTTHFKGEYGRLRAVTVDSAGSLLVSTSNRDGRGTPSKDDDRILKIKL